jgi:two-component system NtrC family sensor kinase
MNRRFSLRTELLLNIALLAATALSLAVASVVVLYGVIDPDYASVYISMLVAADVVVLVGYVAYQIEKVVVRPLHAAQRAAEAIADGDLTRRLGTGDTVEMNSLATSVNRMTDRLLEERAHLVRAEKLASVGRLAAGVAHEIGNPLGAINGYIHVLSTAAPGSTAAREALSGLERESSRIDRIVRGLLDYARTKSRPPGVVDLNDTARTVVELVTAQGHLKQVQFEFSPAPELTFVVGDRHEFEQMLVNLLLNALDAVSGKGTLSLFLRRTTRDEMLSGTRRVSDGGQPQGPPNKPNARAARWLEANPVGDIVMIAVTDSGPGIPDADQERIFDPFYTTKEPGKGTGLGLAIVARAVENAGGAIWVTASREGGAAFRILLPVVRASTPSGAVRRISDERVAIT